jgi:tetratricopeptide (TPR) repeat protein
VIGSLPDAALRVLADRVGDRFREEEGELAAPRSLRLRLLASLCPNEFLRATCGNRSTEATYVDSATGKLTPLDLRRSARHRAKAAQWALLYSTPVDVLSSFDTIARDHPRSHHPNAYRGEVLLWLGRHEEAAADFQGGLDKNPRARWLHIGMGAVQVFRGNFDAAIASFQRSIDVSPLLVGPTLLAYRGEALRLAGKTREAVHDLQMACRDNPTRVSAWVNLWLAEDDLGHVGERDAVWDELWARSRYLLSDAAEECFSQPILNVESPTERKTLLEHVLCMMRGNRSSSCVTYFTKTNELRTVRT